MWDRKLIKSNAKIAIGQGRYWPALAVVLTITSLMLVFTMINEFRYSHWMEAPGGIYVLNGVSFLIRWFVLYPLTIGMAGFFVKNRFGNTQYGNVFSGFRKGYFNGVGTMFVTNLFVGLWSLLFVIPGIVKALQYFFVPYILSDNPHISGSRARQLSQMLTDGEKGSIFVLQLSFLGWYILAALPGSIISVVMEEVVPGLRGAVLIAVFTTCMAEPYPQASYAELYIFLRDRAIQSGRIDPAELCLAPAVL